MAISHDTAAQLSHELVRLMKLFQSLRQHAPRLHPGVDTASYPILFNLHDGPRRVSDLAGCVHSDVSTVSRQVTGLVTHGLVEKVPDPQDGRAQVLSLTDSGAQLLERLKDQRGEWFRSVLADWSEDEAQAFIGSLERLMSGFEHSREQLLQMAAAAAPAGSAPAAPAGSAPAPSSPSPSKEQ
jgi:DNA-binding MarR family transcriptional regulator